MSDVKSDIQIAREAKMQPINDILAKINVPDESAAFSPMGRHIAKINLEYKIGIYLSHFRSDKKFFTSKEIKNKSMTQKKFFYFILKNALTEIIGKA